jgi:Ca2+-binding EF-hand superfamily protein
MVSGDGASKRPYIHGNEDVVSSDVDGDDDDDGEIREAFRVFDKNGDGLISASDLRSTLSDFGLLSASTSFRRINSMIRRADTDLDGFVSLPEFKSMIMDEN